MNVQAAPPPYTPVGGSNMASGNPPVLGSQVPGASGGLPALSGLSATQNPVAQQLQSMGRGDDTMLVHMTPNEVNSLQGLAMAAGGSLTINPQTGLPEAGFLKKLLPMLAGIGLNFVLPGSGIVATLGGKAATAGLMVGAGTTALTGDLSKGLMAGLGAFGGASLAGGLGGAVGGAANQGAKLGAEELAKGAVETAGKDFAKVAGKDLLVGASKGVANTVANVPGVAASALDKTPGFLSQFGQAAKGTMTGLGAKVAPMAAGMGVLSSISDATAPQMPKYNSEEDDYEYVPMGPGVREVRFQTPEQMRASGGAEFPYFTPTNPAPMPLVEQPRRFAEGGLAAVPPQGFEDLVSFFGATNPGAITASMYPTSPTTTPGTAAPASGGETVYDFSRRAPNATANSLGIGDGMNPYGTFGIPDLSGLNINAILSGMGYVPASQPSQPTAPIGGGQGIAGDLGLTLGDIMEYQNTPGGGTSTAPASVRPAPSAPPIMMPENSSLPTQVSIEDIMANYTPPSTQPVYRAPEPEPMPIQTGRGGRYRSEVDQIERARGGVVNMRDGAFVVDARTVSELGNGSSNAGIEMLSRMGGRPVRGPGDGVSDSVRASIGGKQEARVARDEVIFSPEAVRRLGGGSESKGTKKLYALMDMAHKARKKAKRGQDTKVRKGLA